MPEKTGLEHQEDEVKGLIFGNPAGIGGVDKSMLEMTPTNRLVIDCRQSELQLTCNLLHAALVATDNRRAKLERIQDSQTGQWHTVRKKVDHWLWLKEFNHQVQTNQLTIRGYSRAQHLRQQASQVAVAVEEEQRNWLQRLFGG